MVAAVFKQKCLKTAANRRVLILISMKILIYLHGFRSSSQSHKALALGAALRALSSDWEYITPDLSFDPDIAFAQIDALMLRCQKSDLTLVGSSLGGYYAQVCAEAAGCRAVLLNPSLAPWDSLLEQVGPQTAFYGDRESFTFTNEHLAALHKRNVPVVTAPENFLVVVEMGDELLDHRATLTKFADSPQIAVAGGNHDLASFPSHIGAILRHAGLSVT